MWNEQAAELGVPIERVGAVMLALNEEQLESLDTYFANAHKNGVTDVERFVRQSSVGTRARVRIPSVLGGLWIPPREHHLHVYGVRRR